ncbi:MAG: protein phosphatase 2C domain-containing protein [Cyanobacteria bacterium P01_D01_bin.1]
MIQTARSRKTAYATGKVSTGKVSAGKASKPALKQYVWALGHATNKVPIGDLVDGRYQVVAPSIWLDTRPEQSPKVPDPIPDFVVPYLKAYPYQLNLPGIYGICHQASGEAVLLLSNVPVNQEGHLMPAIAKVWPTTTAFRQVYWLWQMISLWEPLNEFGAAASLLKKTNIRVEAWRVRLIGLSTNPAEPSFADLAAAWESTYLPGAKPAIATLLQSVCQALRSDDVDFESVKAQINAQLLRESAGATMEFQVAGATSTGPTMSQNEDACYPSRGELQRISTADLPLLPRLAIVCDGVGGHEGGEVASQRVVRSLQLQLRSLLTEAMNQAQPLAPRLVIDQIEAAIRVANNLIVEQNDQQGRAARRRMGTTLVMALVLPQKVETADGTAEVNELYLTHIGDSRAYWVTADHCQQLTVDDDIAGREVSAGNSFYTAALQRPDAHALSQAVGMRDYSQLKPHTQRFLFESSGVLLLCSDGLSDNDQVEASWANYIGLIMKQIVPLDEAVDSWIELANQRNGHDNVAVVLMNAIMTREGEEAKALADTANGAATAEGEDLPRDRKAIVNTGASHSHPLVKASGQSPKRPVPPAGMTPASRALLYGEDDEDDTALMSDEITVTTQPDGTPTTKTRGWVTALLALVALGVVGVVGWLLWSKFDPSAQQENAPEEVVPEVEPSE